MGRLLLLVGLVALMGVTCHTPISGAAVHHDNFPLHPGSRGPRVATLQWELAGHKPNKFNEIKPTLKHYTPGIFGARTKAALLAYKYRLGYPKAGQCGEKTTLLTPAVTRWFFWLLAGKVKRSSCWLTLASGRVAAVKLGGFTKLGFRIKQEELSWLGIQETENNGGPCISTPCTWHGVHVPALQSVTGAYFSAWCVSTQQTAFKYGGYGTFANDTASVYYALDFYAAKNMVHVKAEVGALVAFVDYDSHGNRIPGSGHMGFVVKITATGFASVEGNASNGVHEFYHDLTTRHPLFIYLSGVAK